MLWAMVVQIAMQIVCINLYAQNFKRIVYRPCAPLLLLFALVGVPMLFLPGFCPNDGRPVCFFFWPRGMAVPVRIAVCRFWPAIVGMDAIPEG